MRVRIMDILNVGKTAHQAIKKAACGALTGLSGSGLTGGEIDTALRPFK
jgi:hypothetical protein